MVPSVESSFVGKRQDDGSSRGPLAFDYSGCIFDGKNLAIELLPDTKPSVHIRFVSGTVFDVDKSYEIDRHLHDEYRKDVSNQ